MSEIKALEKLRAAGRNMAKGRNLENHEECNLLLVIADEIQEEVDVRFMALPLDADGVPIHIGDELEDNYTVTYVSEHWVLSAGRGCMNASRCRHVKPDPLKELLSELANEIWEASCTCQTTWSDSGLEGIEERYADRIRELMGGTE